MLLFIGKLVLLFAAYVTAVRLLGKTALAQLTPHDFGAIFFLAYIIFGSVKPSNLGESFAGVATIIALHFAASRLSLVNKLNTYIMGEPMFLIKDGVILSHNLKRSRYTLMELLSSIRTAGYFDISDIDYAILEPNGQISVLPKQETMSVTPAHLGLEVEERGLPVAVVVEGQIQHDNLTLIEKDESWLKKKLRSEGYELSDIFFATIRDRDYRLKVYREY